MRSRIEENLVAALQVLVAKSRSGGFYLQEESNLGFDSPVQKSENALNDESEAKIMFDTKWRTFIYSLYNMTGSRFVRAVWIRARLGVRSVGLELSRPSVWVDIHPRCRG